MKKWKWFLVIVLVLFLAIGGTALYFFKFKTYDVADEKVDAVLEETFELELPDGKVIVVDKDGNVVDEKAVATTAELPVGATVNEDGVTVSLPDGQVVDNDTTLPAGAKVTEQGVATLPSGETTTIDYVVSTPTAGNENETAAANGNTGNTQSNSSTQGGTSSNDAGSEAQGGNTSANTNTNAGADSEGTVNNGSDASAGENTTTPPATNGKPTVSDIKNKYAGSFASLEAQASAKLNGLIGTAKSEYVQSQASGEGVSYAYFYQKYYGAATALEANTDNAFNALLSVVKSELQQNGYDATYANSFVTEYEAAKSAREASILNQLK